MTLPARPLRLPPGMKWRAHDAAGIGHLLPRTHSPAPRYLCGRLPVAERYAWPMRERCGECVTVLEEGRL